MSSVLERNIQIELYRVLKNLVEKKFSIGDVEFVGVRFEPTINGRPDLVVEAIDKGKKLSLLVIETKRKVPFVNALKLRHLLRCQIREDFIAKFN